MTCQACADPSRGEYRTDCRACQLRDIAGGPHFFFSMRNGRLTPEYRKQLLDWGDDIAAVHAEVKAAAKTVVRGSVAA